MSHLVLHWPVMLAGLYDQHGQGGQQPNGHQHPQDAKPATRWPVEAPHLALHPPAVCGWLRLWLRGFSGTCHSCLPDSVVKCTQQRLGGAVWLLFGCPFWY